MNAVLVKGDAVGADAVLRQGRRRQPTASAVVADLVDITRLHTADPEHRVPHLAFQPDQLSDDADPADGGGGDLLLPAHARGATSPACSPTSRASSPTRDLDRRDGAAGAGRGRAPGRHHHAHPPRARRTSTRRSRRSRSCRPCSARSCASGWRSCCEMALLALALALSLPLCAQEGRHEEEAGQGGEAGKRRTSRPRRSRSASSTSCRRSSEAQAVAA